jgi:L-2,4-diaminobutyrate decarboxylase
MDNEGSTNMPFLSDAQIIINALDEYYRESISAEKPAITQQPLAKIISELQLASYSRDGGLTGERLAEFIANYLPTTTRLHHPGYMSHQVAVPHYAGSLAALIDTFTNNVMAIYEMGPGAASIEYHVINTLLEKIGWEPAPLNLHEVPYSQAYAGGVLTHGGSLTNLTALVAARTKLVPDVWEDGIPHDLAILAPAGAHYSIARAAGIMGIGRKGIFELDVNEKGAIIPEKLPQAYERLLADGKRAIALVANACSTAVGIYDPLDEIGDFCNEHDIWFHVDGAHGASALFSKKHRTRLKGIEKADSLTWDAHKLMRTPTVCAALLVKDHRDLDAAFKQEASYLFHDKEQPGFDFIHRTVECTKAGLGLKFFFVLAALGEQGIADYIDRQYDLAIKAYDYLVKLDDFTCPVRPQSNILCFRIDGDDEMQIMIRDRLNEQGQFYLSTTSFMGTRYLRVSLMNPDTTMQDIQDLVHKIRSIRGEGF